MPQTVHVAADDRETDAGVIAVLRETENVEVAVERLKCGDYRAWGRRGPSGSWTPSAAWRP